MALKHPSDSPPRRDSSDFDKVCQFDTAWRNGAAPRIDDFLPPPSDPWRRRFLLALVPIDLEYRWRLRGKSPAAEPRLLEEYAARHPDLAPLPLDLIGEEYRVRQRWGDRPSHDQFVARFAGQGTELRELLAQIDRELASEFVREAGGLVPSGRLQRSPAEPITSVAELTGFLRPFLDAAQRDELTRLQARLTDPRALARELLQREWLTAYQVNQLLLGRGPELLLGPYVLLERLGEGGAGEVFKARHHQMNRIVALKLIRKELLADAEVLGRFYREIQVVSQLDHPNVVHAYDAGPAGNTHFLAMEYAEGTDLGKLVKQGGPLPVLQACEYIRQAACGLAHAHEKGLVHRDIKPHNLIMDRRTALIKLADLGLARLSRPANEEATAVLTGGIKSTGTLTPENAVMIGTLDYLAPEQALDFHKADIRSDIYSLGCTFYYLLAGRPPFAGGTLAEKLVKHQQADPPPLSRLRKDVPAGLEAVLLKMLAKRPQKRYQTPGEVADTLAAFLGKSHGAGAIVRRALGKKLPAIRRPTGRRLALACALVLVIAILLGIFLRGQGPLEIAVVSEKTVGHTVTALAFDPARRKLYMGTVNHDPKKPGGLLVFDTNGDGSVDGPPRPYSNHPTAVPQFGTATNCVTSCFLLDRRHRKLFLGVAFNGDREQPGFKQTLVMYDLDASGEPAGPPQAFDSGNDYGSCRALALHPNQDRLYAGGFFGGPKGGGAGFAIIELDAKGRPAKPPAWHSVGRWGKYSLGVSADGRKLFLGTAPYGLEVCDLDEKGDPVGKERFHPVSGGPAKDYLVMTVARKGVYFKWGESLGNPPRDPAKLAYFVLDSNGEPTGQVKMVDRPLVHKVASAVNPDRLLLAVDDGYADSHSGKWISTGIRVREVSLKSDGAPGAVKRESPVYPGQGAAALGGSPAAALCIRP